MSKEIIQFSHANGFPASCYRTLFQHLSDQYQINYIDTIGHSSKYPVTNNWELLVDELIEAIEQNKNKNNNNTKVIGVGHSLGGSLSLFAAVKRPDLFKGLVLLDAPIFAFAKAQLVRFLKKIHRLYWISPDARKTEKRRMHWSSKEEALDYLAKRDLFKNFSREALQDFVDFGTVPDNHKLKLKFNPKIEAMIYRTLPHNYWEHKFKLKVPTISIIGKETSILHKIDMIFMQKYFKIGLKRIDGGHLFPFEYPEKTAKLVKESISDMLNEREDPCKRSG